MSSQKLKLTLNVLFRLLPVSHLHPPLTKWSCFKANDITDTNTWQVLQQASFIMFNKDTGIISRTLTQTTQKTDYLQTPLRNPYAGAWYNYRYSSATMQQVKRFIHLNICLCATAPQGTFGDLPISKLINVICDTENCFRSFYWILSSTDQQKIPSKTHWGVLFTIWPQGTGKNSI